MGICSPKRYRATKPERLMQVADPIGPQSDRSIWP
jgi:hypothetical protein